MNEQARDRTDRRVADWLDDGPSRAPDGLLHASLARTRSVGQRPGWFAVVLGAPVGPPARSATMLSARTLAAVLALLLAATVMVIVGGALMNHDRRLAVTPTTLVKPSSSPGPTILPSLPLTPVGVGATYLVPATTALFQAAIPATWRLQASGGPFRITIDEGIAKNFDVFPISWLSITAKTETLAAAVAELTAKRGPIAPQPIAVIGAEGQLVAPVGTATDDPVVLVSMGDVVYRITVTNTRSPGSGVSELRQFVAGFRPLGLATKGDLYRDGAWSFAIVYATSDPPFGPGLEIASRITRFAYPDCPAVASAGCSGWIEVHRGFVADPVTLDLPDGRHVSFGASSYVEIAREWESKVGRSRGSSTDYWQGVLAYQVDNSTIKALFVIRGSQRIVFVAHDRGETGTDRFHQFLDGLTLLPSGT